MKTQQAAEREEQQRIKSLVLNYDLRDGEEQQDGDFALPLLPNPNIHKCNAGLEKATASHSRSDKPARAGQRARKLQLSDVTDWYDPENNTQISHVQKVHSEERLGPKRSPLLPAHRYFSSTSSSKKGKGPPHNSGCPRLDGRGRLSKREIAREHAARNAFLSENARRLS